MLTKEQIQAVADVVRSGKQIGQNILVDLLDGCVDTIEHYREQTARAISHVDRSGYHPFVSTSPETGAQVLIQIFTDDDGGIDLVQLATREAEWFSWGPPITARKG